MHENTHVCVVLYLSNENHQRNEKMLKYMHLGGISNMQNHELNTVKGGGWGECERMKMKRKHKLTRVHNSSCGRAIF